MLTNGKSKRGNLHYNGCSCCNSKAERRTVKKINKRREERAWKKREL